MADAAISKPVPLTNGLVYVNAGMPGFTRVRRGQSFRYRDTEGRWLNDADELARIRQLAIPPAYTDVWICPLANGHLQATGMDARGRKQYRYHAEWRLLKDETKFERLEQFGRALPKIRARVARDLRAAAKERLPGRAAVLATLVRLLDITFLRVGNDEYANSNRSYGLTTLRNRHVDVRGTSLKLRFRGKSGVLHEAKVDDPRVTRVIRRCQQLPGQELFQFQGPDGEAHSVSSSDVNDYLREAAQDNFTAKDFRTWHGTVQALELTRLACSAEAGESTPTRVSAKEILGAVASQLGNTPAVCKKAYIHPAVLTLGTKLSSDSGAMTEIWKELASAPQSVGRLHSAEARLLAFLRQHRLAARRAEKAIYAAKQKKAQRL
ncbi:DNA topoisomerase type I [Variovorax sp. PBS-H4]|uniref:DNA topoisomerase IB n=1 Tax=Variovorax sp. PBS-H4 TaxID=434008 RepID=UPI001316B572|nr:DNA topoisomerase IB [Variovorax sp. PBS-H4]VTU39922.1 DNA topoisomerase type I [Variovorax sp. PBS-H4]